MSDITSTSKSSARPDHSGLAGLASRQGGYFIAAQAEACGFTRGLLAYHARSGHFLRIRRGLYRLPDYPASPNEKVIAAWLSVGKETTVVSHFSALALLGLVDSRPDVVHLTVPRSRRNLPSIPGVRIHTSVRPLLSGETATQDGVAVTAATRSILDAADAGAPPAHIDQAVGRAIRNNLVTADELLHAAKARGRRTFDLIERATAAAQRAGPRRAAPRRDAPAGKTTARAEPSAAQTDPRMRELLKHLSALPSEDQELLTLHFEEEQSIQEIADVKNLDPDKIRDRILRALVVLRARISDRG